MKNKPWIRAYSIGLALRAALPWHCHGFRYMDEHWQVMEPANSLVHGQWSITTEWREGLRSWIYPWLVSLPLRLAELLGIHDPLWIASFVRMIHGLIAASAIPMVYLFVEKLVPKRSRVTALAAAWAIAVWPFAIYCGFHTHGEMAGALCVLAGVAIPSLWDEKKVTDQPPSYLNKRRMSERSAYIFSGAAFGMALALKIDVAVAGLGFGLWQLLHRRVARALWLALGVAPFVALVGFVDWLTWGRWFQSVLGHANANLVEGVGNQWGVSPWYQHVAYFFDIATVPALIGAAALAFTWKKIPDALRATWFVNAFFVLIFATIPHKEKRFLAPLVYTGIAAGLATLPYAKSRFSRKATKFATAAGVFVFAIHLSANAVTYLINRPWWDRIRAIHEAGQIPGIEKMFSPQWPAIFYLPRHLPSEAIDASQESIRSKTQGLGRIGIATDWEDLSAFTREGFNCQDWPQGARSPAQTKPRAVLCERF